MWFTCTDCFIKRFLTRFLVTYINAIAAKTIIRNEIEPSLLPVR